MATFKCLQSGTLVTFVHQHDIDSMKGHAGYVRVDVPAAPEPVKELSSAAPEGAKRLGRPRRATETI